MRQLVRKDNEAYAIQRNMRVSPSKANAVLEMIRGKKAENALNILGFSTKLRAPTPATVVNAEKDAVACKEPVNAIGEVINPFKLV